MDHDNRKTLIVIPAFNPSRVLIDYVGELLDYNFEVLVINDGSKREYEHVFARLAIMRGCKVLNHAMPMGRGRSLKNAFNYFLTLENLENYSGLLTACSNAEYKLEDIEKIALEIKKHPNELILGCKNFDSYNIPSKIKLINKITRLSFKSLYGKSLKDTQTELRGYPKNIVGEMLNISGEGFEYETRMLIATFEKNIKIREVDIETIYYNKNKISQPNSTLDYISFSKVIFGPFFKFSLASFSSFLVDISLFKVFLTILVFLGIARGYILILMTTILARIISALVNFFINKNFVFKEEKSKRKTLYRYYIVSTSKVLLSSLLVYVFWRMTSISEVRIKIVIDTILFFLSYKLLYNWVFRSGRKKNKKLKV